MSDQPSQKCSLLSRMLSWSPFNAFLVSFLIGGVLLCAGSFALHIYDLAPKGSPYSCEKGTECGKRQVGYLWAPNWSLTYSVFGPLALCLMLQALRSTRNALNYLFDTEMVRDEDMEPVRDHLSSRAWETGSRMRRTFIAVCAGFVPAIIAYPEWYSHNLQRIRAGVCNDCDPSDYDWGLAAIIKGVGWIPGWENAVFDFFAFTCEALLIGAAVCCFLYLLDLDQALPSSESRVNKCLLPNLRSSDPRRGFEKFEEPLQLMLNACLTFFLICYAIRVNRLYMRSVGTESIWDFIQTNMSDLTVDEVLDSKGAKLLSYLLKTPSDPKYQEFLGGIALLLISIFSLGVITLTVGRVARYAKANAKEFYEGQDARSLFGLPLEEERDRANKMTTWPLEWRYFQLDALLAIMFMALVSLWYYRIGFYLVLIVIMALLARFRKKVAGK